MTVWLGQSEDFGPPATVIGWRVGVLKPTQLYLRWAHGAQSETPWGFCLSRWELTLISRGLHLEGCDPGLPYDVWEWSPHSEGRCWDVEPDPDDCVSAPEFSCAWNQRPTVDKSEVPGFLSVHATIPVHTVLRIFFFLPFWRIQLSPYPPFPVWVSQANNPIRCFKKEYFHGQMDLIDCVEQISPLGDPQCTLAH